MSSYPHRSLRPASNGSIDAPNMRQPMMMWFSLSTGTYQRAMCTRWKYRVSRPSSNRLAWMVRLGTTTSLIRIQILSVPTRRPAMKTIAVSSRTDAYSITGVWVNTGLRAVAG